VNDFDVIQQELRMFSEAVAAKPQLVAANKIDALDDRSRLQALRDHAEGLGYPFHAISGVTGDGLPGLLEAMWQRVDEARRVQPADASVDVDAGPDLLPAARVRPDQ
jgi:GTP-binding protein